MQIAEKTTGKMIVFKDAVDSSGKSYTEKLEVIIRNYLKKIIHGKVKKTDVLKHIINKEYNEVMKEN